VSFVARVNRVLFLVELEIDTESYLIFEPPLLQAAALLFDNKPRKIMQSLSSATHGNFDGVPETLVGRANDFDSFENCF